MEENINPDTLADGSELKSSDGDGSETPSIKDKLNESLGKDFKDDESALKAVKDTFDYVGKVGKLQTLESTMKELQSSLNTNEEGVIQAMKAKIDESPAPVDTNKFVSREEFEETKFYGENPKLKEHKALIDAFRSKPENQGKPIGELLDSKGENADAELISALDSATAQAEAKESKSVLQSNPRLGQVSDKMTSAKEALAKNDDVKASKDAVGAVIDAYEL